MIKSKKFKTPLYGTTFTVIIYDDNDELNKLLKNQEVVDKIEDFDGAVLTHKDHLYIVFNCSEKGYPTPGIIAHESKHLVNNIFIRICHELDRWNDEPECYLLSWIVNRIHEFKDSIK